MNRRNFIRIIPSGVIGLILAGPSLARKCSPFVDTQPLRRQRTLADFLQAHGSVYDPREFWDDPQIQGRLLIGLAEYGSGGYEFFVDGVTIQQSIESIPFDSKRQRLQVFKNGQSVWNYDPRHSLAPQRL